MGDEVLAARTDSNTSILTGGLQVCEKVINHDIKQHGRKGAPLCNALANHDEIADLTVEFRGAAALGVQLADDTPRFTLGAFMVQFIEEAFVPDEVMGISDLGSKHVCDDFAICGTSGSSVSESTPAGLRCLRAADLGRQPL